VFGCGFEFSTQIFYRARGAAVENVALFSTPGEFYSKKEDGLMRVHNSGHLRGHVMREYLATRTEISVSKYPWDRSEMGFLAFTWSKKKRLRYSKQETQQHIFDKKAHGWNIKKGDPKFEAICPLCLHNDETQAHILLRCCHPQPCSTGERNTLRGVQKSLRG
jgi:hypothetical protein